VAAAGNGAFDLDLPVRPDATSPDFVATAPDPEAAAYPRTVTDDCLRALVLSELASYLAPVDRRQLLRDALRAVTR